MLGIASLGEILFKTIYYYFLSLCDDWSGVDWNFEVVNQSWDSRKSSTFIAFCELKLTFHWSKINDFQSKSCVSKIDCGQYFLFYRNKHQHYVQTWWNYDFEVYTTALEYFFIILFLEGTERFDWITLELSWEEGPKQCILGQITKARQHPKSCGVVEIGLA